MTGAGLRYCLGVRKRCFDLVISALGVVLLAPLLAAIALLVVLASGRPVFFRQERVGRARRPFRLLKFRTMMPGSEKTLAITAKDDPRVTAVGRVLRPTKLDELPQLVNVLRGEMSIVGPRPEVPRYVARYSPEQSRVLDVRPGLTDPATILFRDEELLLGSVSAEEREAYYEREVLPRKLALNLEYIDRAGFGYDLVLILRTLMAILVAPRS